MAQRRLKEKRPVISVSLDPEDFKWIESFGGTSHSYVASRIIHAARLAGLTLDEAMSGGVLEDFRDWLKTRRRKSKVSDELLDLLTDYLSR